MCFKIATDSKATCSHCAQWSGFLFIQNATQYVDIYSKPLTHIFEVVSLLFVVNTFNKERYFGVDMMCTECLLYRIMCAVDVFHLFDRVALDVCVCVRVQLPL